MSIDRYFYFLNALKIEVLGMSSQNTKISSLASNLLGERAIFYYQGHCEKMWFDNEIESCSTATDKVNFGNKTKKAYIYALTN